MNLTLVRSFASALLAAMLLSAPAAGQVFAPPAPVGPPSAAGQQNPVCIRLESQLAAVDRGTADPTRAEQFARYEDAAGKQQAELDRMLAQSRRIGCEGAGFFSLFSGQPAQCGPLNGQIQQMRANLDRMLTDLQRMQGGSADREEQRRSVLVALAQNNCGPQYRSAAVQPRGFFDSLFGPGSISTPGDVPQSSTFRTICVRTCDGFYFPISFSTVPSNFRNDEQVCQRMCPAAEVRLYSHRNPGEDVQQAVSVDGRAYTELPNAFQYRKAVNPSCSCRRSGESWADALKHLDDRTVERGDIVVTEERSRALAQPRVDAQGRPIRASRADPRPAAGAPAAKPAPEAPAAEATTEAEPGKRKVRTVGPTFYPVR